MTSATNASDYSATLMDHYRNPRNVGDLPAPDAIALVHDPTCGDLLRLSVRVDGDNIVEARFKAYGCAAAIAACSVITELLSGLSLDDAAGIREDDIVAALDGLPPSRLHAAALGCEGIRRVLACLRQD